MQFIILIIFYYPIIFCVPLTLQSHAATPSATLCVNIYEENHNTNETRFVNPFLDKSQYKNFTQLQAKIEYSEGIIIHRQSDTKFQEEFLEIFLSDPIHNIMVCAITKNCSFIYSLCKTPPNTFDVLLQQNVNELILDFLMDYNKFNFEFAHNWSISQVIDTLHYVIQKVNPESFLFQIFLDKLKTLNLLKLKKNAFPSYYQKMLDILNNPDYPTKYKEVCANIILHNNTTLFWIGVTLHEKGIRCLTYNDFNLLCTYCPNLILVTPYTNEVEDNNIDILNYIQNRLKSDDDIKAIQKIILQNHQQAERLFEYFQSVKEQFSEENKKELSNLLKNNISYIGLLNNYGYSMIHGAIGLEIIEQVEFIITNDNRYVNYLGGPFYINYKNSDLTILINDMFGSKDQSTPLILAIRLSNLQICRLLINNGAKVDLAINRKSPLYYAVAYENLSILELLLKHGASKNINHFISAFDLIINKITTKTRTSDNRRMYANNVNYAKEVLMRKPILASILIALTNTLYTLTNTEHILKKLRIINIDVNILNTVVEFIKKQINTQIKIEKEESLKNIESIINYLSSNIADSETKRIAKDTDIVFYYIRK